MTVHSAKPEWAQSKREKANVERVAAGQKPRRRLWPWALLVLIILAIVAFVFLRPAPPPPVEAQAETATVMQLTPGEITTIAPQTLARTIKVTGSLAPQRQTQLSAQVSGRVLTVRAQPGDVVNQGDVLLQMDTESLQIQLDQQLSTAAATRSQLQLAESQLERTTDLAARGLTPTSGLEEAQSGVEALRANLAALESQVAAARLSLQNATVTAPMDGVVSERTVQPGQTVQPGGPLFTIVDLDELELEGFAPIGSSAQIAPGQSVSISVEGLPDLVFQGTVDRVNPVAISGTRTLPVYILLGNAEGALRGGMFATGRIVVAERADALAVPEAAIREDAEGFYVLKLEDETVIRQAIERGAVWGDARSIEIMSGLTAQDVVVTAPLSQLEPGDSVEMVEG